VLSTLRRRQRDGGHAGRKPPGTGPDGPRPVFRAGHCYRAAPVHEAARSEPPSSVASTSCSPGCGLRGSAEGAAGRSFGRTTGLTAASRCFSPSSGAELH
jgi:hypothetical protein